MTYRLTLKEELAAMNSERAKLERRYQNSDQYVTDARQWIADPVELPLELVAAICTAYGTSNAYRTVIDDAEAGETRW